MEETPRTKVHADRTHRALAKFIDVIVAMALWRLFPAPVGFFAAATYILIADGIPPRGQSLGKKFIGLKVVVLARTEIIGVGRWKHSMVRNLPFVLTFFATGLGFIGVLVFVVGLVLIAFETYFVFTDAQGIRLGDIFANTKVLDV